MPVLGSLRRLAMAPDLVDVTFEKRGFPVNGSPATEQLEAIPQAVICGFEWGLEARSQWELEHRLGMVDPEVLGFAYEGATMACTIRDVMPGGGSDRTRELLTGPGRPHILVAYIGIGFAMARLPRVLWKKVLPDLTGSPYYPTMSWLAVDGYAFDRAYFDTERWVGRQELPAAYPWAGSAAYFPRAVDQGIGRALWFICGAQVAEVTAAVNRFATSRHADLWSGVGLAATFAGGCGPDDLAALRRDAGPHQAALAQGSVFAVKARDCAGFVPAHSEAATAALTELSVKAASVLADDAEADAGADGAVPAYEVWRRNVRARFAG